MELFSNFYKNKRVLVTGATGFKGTWLSVWLNILGSNVIGYSDMIPTKPSMFELCGMDKRINSYRGDVRDYTKLLGVMEEHQPEIVFHLAAQPIVRRSYLQPIETFETNVMGTTNLLEACVNVDSVKNIVVITTDKCYENKEAFQGYAEEDRLGGYDPYSASKACVEMVVNSYRDSFLEEKGVKIASARAGNVIGGGDWAEDRLIPDFIRSIEKKSELCVRSPEAIRPWQHVLEPIYGYMKLAYMMEQGEGVTGAWNFGPENTDFSTVQDLLNMSLEYFDDAKVVYQADYQKHETQMLKLKIDKAKNELNWKPVYTTREAVEKTMEWYSLFFEDRTRLYDFTKMQIEEYYKNIKL